MKKSYIALMALVLGIAGFVPANCFAFPSGGFVDSGQILNAVRSGGAALGDLDGDGDLDAYFTNNFGSQAYEPDTVWFNDGLGNFTDSGQMLWWSTWGYWMPTDRVELGDVDGDGDLDAVVISTDWEGTVLLNDGTGFFTESGQMLAPAGSNSDLALGDVDGDGDLDIVFSTYFSFNPNLVWLNDGTGVFTDSGQSLGNDFATDVELADLDGDGDLDAFFATASSDTVWLNDGTGVFVDSGQLLGTEMSNAVSLGDIDGDGDIDAFVANGTSLYQAADSVWINDGAAGFTLKQQIFAVGVSESGVLADVDNDQDLDLLINNANSISVWLNKGNGDFYDSTQRLSVGMTLVMTVPGDLDGDGDLDLVSTELGEKKVWMNDNPELFGLSTLPPIVGEKSYLADFDNDGDLDMLETAFGGSHVLLNSGNGNLVDSGQVLTGSARGAALADVDSDGDIDILLVINFNNTIWLNDGTGNFTYASSTAGSFTDYDVDFGDLDGDGDLDLYVATDSYDKVLLNNGSGVFTSTGQMFGLNFYATYQVELKDYDRDGDLDALLLLGTNIGIWNNDGTGHFADSGIRIGSFYINSFSTVDLDGDGDLDIYMAKQGPNEVWLNDGAGNYSNSGQLMGNANSQHVTTGDIDGDGFLDAFVSSAS